MISSSNRSLPNEIYKINTAHKDSLNNIFEEAFNAGYYNYDYSFLYELLEKEFCDRYYFRTDEIKILIKRMIDSIFNAGRSSYYELMGSVIKSIVDKNIIFIEISTSSSRNSSSHRRNEPIEMNVSQDIIQNTNRRLTAQWTFEPPIFESNPPQTAAELVIRDYNGISAEEELTNILANEISAEIDREIMRTLQILARE